VLLTDTVGFIRKLPHRLVESFKATLEEVVQAELLLHVVDLSHPQAEEQILAVNAVLEEIGAAGKPTLMVLNKIDRFEQRDLLRHYLDRFPNSVAVSARTGEGVPGLLSELGAMLRPARELVELLVPHDAAAAIARLHEVAQVVERDYTGEAARFKARIPPDVRREFAAFIVPDVNGADVRGIGGTMTNRQEAGKTGRREEEKAGKRESEKSGV
jgi:GTP-binding protein HflX